MKKPAFENPLIPHARMRALYRALVETRVLSSTLPAASSIRPNLEACLAAAAIDLHPSDYALDPFGGQLLHHIRQLATRSGPQAPTRRTLTLTATQAFPGTAAERLLCAAGAALAFKAAANQAAVLAFAGHNELKAADWSRTLALAAAAELPLLLIALPAPKPRRNQPPAARTDLARLVARLPAPNGYVPLPVIPVDAGDTIALYRVVQESLVRARAGGGAVVIDCIDMGTDPIALLGQQLLERRIATPARLAGIEPAVRKLL